MKKNGKNVLSFLKLCKSLPSKKFTKKNAFDWRRCSFFSVFPFASWTMCITSWSSSSLSVLQSTNRLRRWKSEAAVPSSATGRASKAPSPTSPCAAVILTTGRCWSAFGRTQGLSGRSPFLMQQRKRSSEWIWNNVWSNVKIIMQIFKRNSPNPSSNQRGCNQKTWEHGCLPLGRWSEVFFAKINFYNSYGGCIVSCVLFFMFPLRSEVSMIYERISCDKCMNDNFGIYLKHSCPSVTLPIRSRTTLTYTWYIDIDYREFTLFAVASPKKRSGYSVLNK